MKNRVLNVIIALMTVLVGNVSVASVCVNNLAEAQKSDEILDVVKKQGINIEDVFTTWEDTTERNSALKPKITIQKNGQYEMFLNGQKVDLSKNTAQVCVEDDTLTLVAGQLRVPMPNLKAIRYNLQTGTSYKSESDAEFDISNGQLVLELMPASVTVEN